MRDVRLCAHIQTQRTKTSTKPACIAIRAKHSAHYLLEADGLRELLESDESAVVGIHFVKQLLQRFDGHADAWANDARLVR